VAVSHQRPPFGGLTPLNGRPRRRRRWTALPLLLLLALIVAALAAGAIVVRGSHGTLRPDGSALARVTLPIGGGRIENLSAVTGPHSTPVPVALRGDRVWPTGTIPAGEAIEIDLVVRRPASIAWLTGARQHLHLSVQAPVAALSAQYVTLRPGQPLEVSFAEPVSVVSYGAPGHLERAPLGAAQRTVTLPHTGAVGSVWVSAVPRAWEIAPPKLISWFPAGAVASAIASPAPGTLLKPGSPIQLTFSKPVSQALGTGRPPVSPATPGAWHELNSHTIVFQPAGGGYGLGADVTVALPAGVSLLGATHSGAGTIASWRVPPGSTLRLQQLLAQLGYLPLDFTPSAPVAPTEVAQETAAVSAPAGNFSWRYPNVPPALRTMWAPGSAGELTRGAVMAFENDHGLTADGDAGPLVWKALIAAALAGQRSTFGYTFVEVNKGSSPQSLTLWHNGQTVLSTIVNTGIASAPTASGTFAVYEHLRVTTMSGTNPDGSHYHDPGIQFVSYFNGGDALHAFTRAQYGFPQSLGCVEMPLGPAGQVWPYTPIGTIVNVQ
jgi:peptidoglycan hydrolase-like protein with peptidoglycan-binding domain